MDDITAALDGVGPAVIAQQVELAEIEAAAVAAGAAPLQLFQSGTAAGRGRVAEDRRRSLKQ